ncbi:MAG: hypothetical protein DCC59_00555 [Chloroflexi bacterium]|nr:glycosyltransferase family 39 protein [Anaerolineales bacterium]RIK55504.1 MAG: hypothetical protein DCC59_00555 [Chloroflexota bacterium]
MSKNFWNSIFVVLSLLAIVFSALFAASPAAQPIPHRDSGVFLYIAAGILDGKLPYLDFWDHKGPLIYYINAIGLSIASQSYWGVWMVEFVSLALSAALFFLTMRRFAGGTIAWVGASMWLLAFGHVFTTQFGAGNHVEEYALPFYAAQLYLYPTEKDERSNLRFLWVGIFAGLAVLLRPNLSSLLAAIILIALWSMFRGTKQGRHSHLYSLLFLTLGAGTPLLIAAGYFWRNHALRDLFSDVFLYNFLYAGRGNLYGEAFLNSFRVMGALNYLAFLAWIALIVSFNKLPKHFGDMGFVKLILVAAPLEIAFSLVSGFGYLHYFITWLPLLGGLACLFIRFISQIVPVETRRYFPTLLAAFLAIQAAPFAGDLRVYFQNPAKDNENGANSHISDESPPPALTEIQPLYEFAPKGSPVLFWGNEVQFNFIMDLPSPSRYVYIYPFLMPDYAAPEMQREFLDAIAQSQPVIVDIQPSLTPPIQSLKQWRQYPKAMPLIRYIAENYSRVAEIPVNSYYLAEGREWALPQKWIVWVRD